MKKTAVSRGLGFLAFDTQNRSMCLCLPREKPRSLPNSTALNLKLKTKVDLSLNGSLKCPFGAMTALPGEQQGVEMREHFSIKGCPGTPASSIHPSEIRWRMSLLVALCCSGCFYLYCSKNQTLPSYIICEVTGFSQPVCSSVNYKVWTKLFLKWKC